MCEIFETAFSDTSIWRKYIFEWLPRLKFGETSIEGLKGVRIQVVLTQITQTKEIPLHDPRE